MKVEDSPEIIGSVIATSSKQMQQCLNHLSDAVTTIQLDVMDGIFVSQKSLLFKIPELPKTYQVEAHLMMQNPLEWINEYHEMIDTAIIHIESDISIPEAIATLRKYDLSIGLAVGPSTPIDEVFSFMQHIDLILIFTADVMGGYGAQFNKDACSKITSLKKAYPNAIIEVDGGIDSQTIQQLFAAGATRFVCGSYIQKNDAHEAVANLYAQLD